MSDLQQPRGVVTKKELARTVSANDSLSNQQIGSVKRTCVRDEQSVEEDTARVAITMGDAVLCPGFLNLFVAQGTPPKGRYQWSLEPAQQQSVATAGPGEEDLAPLDEEPDNGAAILLIGLRPGQVRLKVSYTAPNQLRAQAEKDVTVHVVRFAIDDFDTFPGIVAPVCNEEGMYLATGPGQELVQYDFRDEVKQELGQLFGHAELGGYSAGARVRIELQGCSRPQECAGNHEVGFVQVLDAGVKRTHYPPFTMGPRYDPPLPAPDIQHPGNRPFYHPVCVNVFQDHDDTKLVVHSDSPAGATTVAGPWPWEGFCLSEVYEGVFKPPMTRAELSGQFRLWLAVRNRRLWRLGEEDDADVVRSLAFTWLRQVNWSFTYDCAVDVAKPNVKERPDPRGEVAVQEQAVDPVQPPALALLRGATAEDRMEDGGTEDAEGVEELVRQAELETGERPPKRQQQ